MTREFWRDWKRKTKLEENAIVSLKSAKKIVLDNAPKKEIISIYAKGSFVRREMNEQSDVDLATILRTNRHLRKLDKLAQKCKHDYKPEINIGFLSLWELKNNKRFYETKKPRGRPYLFIKKVKDYKLIYGSAINPEDYELKDNRIYLKNRIKTFRNLFIPLYRKKEIGFGGLIKQVFWLIEVEEEVNGNNPPNSWKKLDKSIKNKGHIVHLTYKYRLNNPKDGNLRNKYMNKLDKYLQELELR